MENRALNSFVKDNIVQSSHLVPRRNVVPPHLRRSGIADEYGRESMRIEFLPCWRVIVDIALGTENVKVTDIRFLTLEYFIRSLVFDCSSWQVVLGVDSVLNSFSAE